MLLLLDLNQWHLGCKPSILTTELRSIDRAVSLTSNCPKEGSSKSSTLWKHENIVWTLWDLNSSKTLQMSCANLITLQSPLVWVLGLEPRTTGSQSQHSTYWITPIYCGEQCTWNTYHCWYNLFSRQSLKPLRFTLHFPSPICQRTPLIAERWGPDPQAFYCSHCFQDKSQSHWVTSPFAYLPL